MVSSSNRFFRLLAAISLWQAISIHARAQDSTWLLDVARANAESMQNYDVSYKITILRDEVENLETDKSRTYKFPKWDEQRVVGRLVLDKQSTDKPTRLLHVRTDEFFYKEKLVQQQTECRAWKEGVVIEYLSTNPNGEIFQAPCTLESLFRGNSIPFFEIANGETRSPSYPVYWSDSNTYWELLKASSSQFKLSRSPSGTLRLDRTRETVRHHDTYDPISNLRTSSSDFPIDPITKQEPVAPTSLSQYAWENADNVYRLRSRSLQVSNRTLSHNEICVFYWHQFNVEMISFPQDVFTDFTVEKCTKFLVDGQSELSAVR